MANVVVSVGPYPLKTTIPGHAAATRATACGETTSPPVHTSRAPARQPGSPSANAANSPAVNHSAVIRPAPASLRRSRELTSSSAMTTRPPDSSGTHSSYVEASKAYGECRSTRVCAPRRQIRSRASARTLRWVTMTPFGSPVEPEVCMMYSTARGSGRGFTNVAGMSSPPVPSGTTSSVRWPDTTSWSRLALSTASSTQPAPPRIDRIRDAGYRWSSGTYAAPHFATASNVTTSSGEWCMRTATRSPGCTPCRVSRRARRSVRACSRA